MRGAGALHCAPGRATHCALRTRAFPSVAVYASASHSATHTPVDVTGVEPAKASLQNLGLPNLLGTHPTILFWLGNHRPRGGRTPLAGLVSATLGVHAPSCRFSG